MLFLSRNKFIQFMCISTRNTQTKWMDWWRWVGGHHHTSTVCYELQPLNYWRFGDPGNKRHFLLPLCYSLWFGSGEQTGQLLGEQWRGWWAAISLLTRSWVNVHVSKAAAGWSTRHRLARESQDMRKGRATPCRKTTWGHAKLSERCWTGNKENQGLGRRWT